MSLGCRQTCTFSSVMKGFTALIMLGESIICYMNINHFVKDKKKHKKKQSEEGYVMWILDFWIAINKCYKEYEDIRWINSVRIALCFGRSWNKWVLSETFHILFLEHAGSSSVPVWWVSGSEELCPQLCRMCLVSKFGLISWPALIWVANITQDSMFYNVRLKKDG